MNDLLEKVMNGLQCKLTAHYDTCKDCPYFSEELAEDYPEFEYFCNRSQIEADALELLKAQEPRVLQIKEMAFLEIAVFIETNGDLEGKGTDLFLAIPYIYAVSQNMLDGYIAFVDGNTDVYDLQAIDYGKCWRCWTSRPTDEQRMEVKWE